MDLTSSWAECPGCAAQGKLRCGTVDGQFDWISACVGGVRGDQCLQSRPHIHLARQPEDFDHRPAHELSGVAAGHKPCAHGRIETGPIRNDRAAGAWDAGRIGRTGVGGRRTGPGITPGPVAGAVVGWCVVRCVFVGPVRGRGGGGRRRPRPGPAASRGTRAWAGSSRRTASPSPDPRRSPGPRSTCR